jgi:Ca2+-transporting ATPase
MEYPWCRTAEEVASDYRVDVSIGLSSAEVLERRAKHGTNELEKEEGKPLWKLVLEQFDDMLVKVRGGPRRQLTMPRSAAHDPCCPQILLLAAGISFVLAYLEEGSHEEGLRAYIEPLVIVLILILNAGGSHPSPGADAAAATITAAPRTAIPLRSLAPGACRSRSRLLLLSGRRPPPPRLLWPPG